MEVLKELPVSGLDSLKSRFLLREHLGGLTEEEFVEVLLHVCADYSMIKSPTEAEARRVFARIDLLGLGRISWEEFSMYAIDSLRQRVHRVTTGEKEEERFRPYHVEQLLSKVHAGSVREMRVLPKIGKVMVVTTGAGGCCNMNLCDISRNLPLFGAIRQNSTTPLAWDAVPQATVGLFSNSIVCSYDGGLVRLFGVTKTNSLDCYLEEIQQMHLKNTQSALHWVPFMKRLAMGSCKGLVTLWEMQNQSVMLRKRLSRRLITKMQSRNQLLYVASLDTHEAVKCLDLEHGRVQYALNDHTLGGATHLLVDDKLLFSAGFERGIVQRPLTLSRSGPVFLYDCVFPHQGCITALERLNNTSLLVSGDTEGNLKFWDLRMGACLQTIKGKKTSSSTDSHTLPELQENLKGYCAAPVRSICHIDVLGKLAVATSKELLVLSSDVSLRPALVDDRFSCRFVFFPNPECFLTVHDSCAKLWSASTGMLDRCSGSDITKCDITSSCLLEPLNRQLLLGTMGGELKAISVALLEQSVDLTPAIQPYILGTEITDIHTVTRYGDDDRTYVMVNTQSTIIIVPFRPDCGPQSVITFQGIVKGFLHWNQIIKTTAITETHFIVATSDARVHFINYRGLVSITHTFQMPAAVEAIIAKPAFMLKNHFSEEGFKGSQSKEFVTFFADVSGRVHIAAMRGCHSNTSGKHSQCGHKTSTEQREFYYSQFTGEMIGSWLPRKPESWMGTQVEERLRQQEFGRLQSRNGKRSSILISSRTRHTRTSIIDIRFGAQEMSLPDPMTSIAVNIVFFDQYNVLVTLDEEGIVRFWNVSGTVAHYLDDSLASSPVLVATWRIPEREVIFFAAASHPTLHLPLLLTATSDLRVTLWTADGISLGTLSTGRETDEASGGRRFGLRPYRLFSEDTTAELWAKFMTDLERSVFSDTLKDSPVRLRRRSQVTLTFSQKKEGMEKPPSQLNFRRASQYMWRSRPSVSLSHVDVTDDIAIVRSQRGSSNSQSIKSDDDKYSSFDERCEAGIKSIVKPIYQGLVTCTASSFSLKKTGVVSLPPLNAATGGRRRRFQR
ncbi:hypothetical protein MOQ_009265 [Trypanosoma cruzi marinkellei]|uniref:EF-hand domain-containing protein n=1 Tax=Trypanosoma cruzi marinkellei TaxID=85056 RepID=K2LWH2_TRYCR|nr:hypothetical protein MOQ_009265 [Trypanosoma cruzi marinkellei]